MSLRQAVGIIADERRVHTLLVFAVLASAVWFADSKLPEVGANGLLHPSRRSVPGAAPEGCRAASVDSDGTRLQGWRCAPAGFRIGTLVYLHGIASNRASGVGVIRRFRRRGFEVMAFDSRANGESEGAACTYGYHEKGDLRRILDTAADGPIVLLGSSLGAATAIQAAAEDGRVSAVVAAETYADLRTIATERAPIFFTASAIARSLHLAEQQGQFRVDAVSPVRSAERIFVPVLLIHGTADVETPPDHSRRVYGALRGLKRLILVKGAGHNGSLRSEILNEAEGWIADVLSGMARSRRASP